MKPTFWSSIAGLFSSLKFGYPNVYQHDEMDCAAACVGSVLKYFKINYPLSKIRKAIRTGPDGVHIKDIITGTPQLGLIPEIYSFTESDDLETIPKPCLLIAHAQNAESINASGHYVVVFHSNKKKSTIADPAWGIVHIKTQELFDRAGKFAVSFSKGSPINEEKQPSFISLLFQQSHQFKKYFVLMFALSIIFCVLKTLVPFLYAKILDQYLTTRSEIAFNDWFKYTIALLLVVALNFLGKILVNRFSFNYTLNILTSIIRSVLGLRYSEFVARRARDYFSSLSYTGSIEGVLRDIYSSFVADFFTFLIYLVAIYYINQKLCILVLGCSIPLLLITLVIYRYQKSILYKINLNSGDWSMDFSEIVSKFKTIKILKSEKFFYEKSHKSLHNLLKSNYEITNVATVSAALLDATSNLASSSILFFGAYLIHSGDISLGDLLIVGGYAAFVWGFFKEMEARSRQLQQAKIAFEKIVVLKEESEVSSEKKIEIQAIEKIDLTQLSFTYPSSDQILLQSINLHATAGEIVCIVGPSGSGKSTLLALLGRLIDRNQGEYLINGIDERKISDDSFRRCVSYVEQELNLFNGPLINSIFHQTVSDHDLERLDQFLKIFGLHESINNLPKGLYSHVSDASKGLSGGELQRLSIIRALLKNPSFLILDEPSSALDEANEIKLFEQLTSIVPRPLILITTHRRQAIRYASQTYELKQGNLEKINP